MCRNAGVGVAGIVKTADSSVAVPGRKVTIVEVKTGARHDTTTGTNGGYTIQVPEGTAKQPAETHVSNSDLDTTRDFVITMRASGA